MLGNSFPETEVRRLLQDGDPVYFPEIVADEPLADRHIRAVSASLLLERVARPKGTVQQPIIIHNAVIAGDLSLAYVDFRCDLRLINCTITGTVDLSFTRFAKAAAFNNCVFEREVNFRGSEAAGDLDWTGAIFRVLDARHLKVGRDLLATGASFEGEARLDQMLVSGTAYFEGAQFQSTVSFDLAKIEGGFDFGGEEYKPNSPEALRTVFHKQARFIGAAIKAYVSFISVEFDDVAWFDGMTVHGDAQFEGVQFRPSRPLAADEYVSFYGIRVVGQATFNRAHFGACVRFDQARLEGGATFCSAHFAKRCRFDNVVFGGPVRFNRWDKGDPPVEFTEGVEFVAAAAPDVHFEGTEFKGSLTLRDANFRTVRFQDADDSKHVCRFPPQKKGWWSFWDRNVYPRIDLRGFVYERILIDSESPKILKFIEPFDVQPYRQAEKVFRSMGDSSAADKVYLAQRWRTLRYHITRSRHLLRALGELAYWALGNFGVRPYRLGVYALILIALSTWQFTKPNAVLPKKDSTCKAHTLNRTEAFGVSVTYFLPVDVPVGACWEPTRDPAVLIGGTQISFLLWATLLRLAGWIVIPLGVAALGGLLRRDPRG